MAKKATDPKTETARRIQRTEAYAEKVRKIFAQTVNEILALNKSMPTLDKGVMYSFDGTSVKMQDKVEKLLRRLNSTVLTAIQQGITLEWEQANDECDKLVQSVYGKEALSNPALTAVTNRNKAAMDAFINRSENGLQLSDRVWNTVKQLREEMEVAMTVAIGEGQSASGMSRKVREYLNDPDLMFRRFRYKDENGEWQRKWKKRVKDEKTGKYKWIDYDRDDYKTGSGVYKSSAKNAMRVTRTETNIAYRRADHERWQQMDFVLGQRIQLSKSHPKKDICDTLQGDYPVEFVFDGWHPQCFCYVTPILVDESEMAKVTEAFLRGETYTPKGKRITDYPQSFKDWVRDNADNIAKSRERGTEPYFIRNNAVAIDEILNPESKELTTLEKAKIRHEARTPEQIEAIKNRWEERKKLQGADGSLKEVLLKFTDPNNITDKEVRDTITAFAKNNPGMFYGGLKDVEIVGHARSFMANSRYYQNGAYDIARGNTINVTDEKFWLFSGETFNPYEELKGALSAISTGADMTFKQEYALESLWHEIRHAQAVGWKDVKMATSSKRIAMETINQFCARHSYTDFVKSLGGKAVNTQKIIESGYGYSRYVSNFQKLVEHINVTQSDAHDYFKDIIVNTPYEDIFDEMVTFVQKEGGYTRTQARNAVKAMMDRKSKDFLKYLK